MPKLKGIIYIAGYGRSGSTLLEKLLNCQPSMHATGELANFFKLYGLSSSLCSCGNTLDKCKFWSNVANELFMKGFSSREFFNYFRIQKRCESFISHGGSFFSKRYHNMYSNFMNPFYEAVLNQLNSEEKVLIDSSKTAYSNYYRPIAISRLAKYRVRVIHLIRDCRGVAWSVKKGLNRELESGKGGKPLFPVSRAIIGWIYSNMVASRLKKILSEDNYILIKYEDLVETPVKILNQLEEFLELDLDESIRIAKKAMFEPGVQLPIMHQLSGNRMRFSSILTIRPDYAWKEKSNSQINYFIKIIAMPFMKKYGYT